MGCDCGIADPCDRAVLASDPVLGLEGLAVPIAYPREFGDPLPVLGMDEEVPEAGVVEELRWPISGQLLEAGGDVLPALRASHGRAAHVGHEREVLDEGAVTLLR